VEISARLQGRQFGRVVGQPWAAPSAAMPAERRRSCVTATLRLRILLREPDSPSSSAGPPSGLGVPEGPARKQLTEGKPMMLADGRFAEPYGSVALDVRQLVALASHGIGLVNYPARWVVVPNALTSRFSALPSIAEIRGTKRPAPPDRAAAS